jgi:flagellar hook-basal body complex protein FliE
MKKLVAIISLSLTLSSVSFAQAVSIATRIATVQRTVTTQGLNIPRVSSLSPAMLTSADANLALKPELGQSINQLIEGLELVASSNDDMVAGLNKTARAQIIDKLVATAIEVASQANALELSSDDITKMNAILTGQAYLSLIGQAPRQQALQGEQLRKYESFIDAMSANISQGTALVAAAEAAAEQTLEGQFTLQDIVDACGSAQARR